MTNEPQHIEKQNTNNRTGARRASKTIATILIAASLVAGAAGVTYYKIVPAIEDKNETKRVVSLVEDFTNEEGLCVIPSEVTVNKNYDTRFADGSKIANELQIQGVKYCEILDQYYTASGSDIAILTYEVTTTEVCEAEKYSIDGTVIYMAPEGYVLDGTTCYRETTKYVTKIVPRSQESTYSSVTIPNVSKYELVDIKEVSTLTYDSICDQTLICDVQDGAVLNEENQCTATLRLVPKEQ